MPERRQHARVSAAVPVAVERDGQVSVLRAANLSAGGVWIALDRGELPSVEPGAQVRVRIDLGSDQFGRPLDVDCEAEVVRVDLGGPDRPPGFALMWTSEDAGVARQLAVILEYLHG
ncbi:MAG: PilZ domain-containing protein [Deltaproteobacteria bacterium]|nr:MAG: PilZ domain-containing protein [Deltaproteobacteria bacterium]